MPKRTAWTKAELKRLAEIAKEYNCELRFEGGAIRLIPIVSTPAASDDDVRRMLEAFGK